ncbi:MAG: ATP-binding protein [Chryseolinea sp.]
MHKEIKILMLEDQEEDAWLIARELKKEKLVFTSMRVDTRTEFSLALDNFLPDVILSDHSLPQFNSIEALDICHQKKINIPFLLVTGAVSEEFAVSCLKKGADDYVLKSNLSRLALAIRHAIRQRKYEHLRCEQEVTLKNQNEELKKLNRELDLFVYSTSHNLRAPLRSVLGLINLSKHELANNQPEALHEYFAMMENSIAQLDNTLKLILDYSKSARLEDEVEEIDFDKVFQETFAALKYINGRDGILKVINVHKGPPFFCNNMRLNLILLNLISNAIKYYDPAKEQSFIKLEVMPRQQMVNIVIEDNGIGIPEELQHSVFDMFFRATEKADGSGLGLYIVKETIQRLGGSVSLLSTQGAGTKFSVTIPNDCRPSQNSMLANEIKSK